MEKIESFKVNHCKLKRGIYVSRKDYDNETGKVMATASYKYCRTAYNRTFRCNIFKKS